MALQVQCSKRRRNRASKILLLTTTKKIRRLDDDDDKDGGKKGYPFFLSSFSPSSYRKNKKNSLFLTHSLHPKGLNVLFSLVAEPAGAAAGVAYLMSVLLAAPAVDPQTLAPKGTVLNAEKATDARGAVRVPFTQILPTALKVVDTSNSGYTGAGWKAGADGLPKLPLNSVLIVVGVGGLILEAAAHAPVLSLFMPRVLQVAGWLALAGFALDKRGK
jgi:hypothetical protein